MYVVRYGPQAGMKFSRASLSALRRSAASRRTRTQLGFMYVPSAAAGHGGQVVLGTSLALTALPIVGIASGIANLFLGLGIGRGCGQPCIDAAKAEQVFEAAGTYVLEVGEQGMLGSAAAVEALQVILDQGKRSLASIGTKQAARGLRNMEKVIDNLISAASQLPDAQSMPLDAGKIQQIFDSLLDTRPGHWYADAVASGQTIAGQAIAQTSQVSQAIAAAQSARSSSPPPVQGEPVEGKPAAPAIQRGEPTAPTSSRAAAINVAAPGQETTAQTSPPPSVESIIEAARAHPLLSLALVGAAGFVAIEVIS